MIPHFLAQADISGLTANFLKDVIIFTVAAIMVMALVVGAVFAAMQYLLDRRRARREELQAGQPNTTVIEPNPLPVQKVFPSATVRELNEKHDEHGRRLDICDKEISSLWNTLRQEDKEIRREMAEKFDAISRALGRIEGKISGDDIE